MRVLLAEDEKSLSNALVAILKRNNYSVDAVYNGQDALDYLDCGVYDVAILDIMMPKMDGITVLKNARAKGYKLPIIMLTAKTEISDKVLGLDSGADDYLTKPFNSQELLARLRSITRRQGDVVENVLTYGDIKLDIASFELKCGTKNVLLTAKEFQIMEMFIKSPHEVFSAEKFMEKIWGYESDTEINVVWTYISYLRKKLTQIGSNVSIKVVRNIGYKLGGAND